MKRFPLVLAVFVLLIQASSVLAQTWNTGSIEFSRLAGFGQAILIDGDQIIATRTGESVMFPSPASQKGGFFVFSQSDGEWMQTQAVVPESVQIGDRFGHAAVMQDNLLAVSAPGANQGCGAVLLFTKGDNGTWANQGRLDNPDCEVDGRMGWSMALVGNRLWAGAPGSIDVAGKVHLFEEKDGTWRASDVVTAASAGDMFGEKIAVSGGQLLVSAPDAGRNAGKVYVFENGEEVASLSASSGRLFGLEMVVAGSRALIAAPGLRGREIGMGPTMPAAGQVFVFEADDNGSWSEVHIMQLGIESERRQAAFGYGTALALTASEAWVGAPFAGSGSGAVYVYAVSGSNAWENTQVLTTRPLAAGAGFGSQVAVDDNLAMVSALRADFGEGRGVAYERRGDQWREAGSLNDIGRGLTALVGEEIRCQDGSVDQFGCENVDLLSFLPIDDVGGGRGVIVNDVWGWTDAATGKEYAIVGRSNGTSFVDVSDPTSPVFVGDLPATEGSSPNAWRDVKVYKDYALVVADNVGKHGMQIFDLKELRNVDVAPATLEPTAVYDRVYSAHNVVVNESTNFVYIVAASGGGETCGGGYHMVDLSDPVNPEFAGCFSDPSSGAGGNHIHDAQCVIYEGPDQDHQGKEICFGANASVFSIADVSDKENPKTVSALDYPNVAYVHQGWLTEDQRYFYINDEGDEVSGLTERTRTLIWDVEDLDDPVFVKAHLGTTAASDHNFYIRDHLMYQSNYVSGLQILDISDPLNPREVGHFDTVPWGENAPGFAGSWSNYPYFESGTIVVSSITEGLFLVRKSPEVVP